MVKRKSTNVISFVSKAKEKGIKLKRPPVSARAKNSKTTEIEDEEITSFDFETSRDLIRLYMFPQSLSMVFQFFDIETQVKYNEYQIDMEHFLLMEQAVGQAEKMLNARNT